MNEEAMRKAFEAELGKHLGYKQSGRGFATNKDGTYVQFSVNQHWELWQAATRAAVPDGLAFDDAVRMARGCTDYGGGHRGDAYDAFHDGIQTVVNVLAAAQKNGLSEYQIAVVHAVGSEVQP